MKKTVFVKNAAVMTVSSIILRFAGIVFKVHLAAKMGSEGVGLYQLTFSLFMLASAFSASGIPTAVTRLVAEESALGGRSGIKRIMSATFTANAVLSAVTAIVLFFGAKPLSALTVSDLRAVPSIRIMALSVFFVGASSVIKGYFIARRKASPGAFSQLLEQSIRIVSVISILPFATSRGLPFACAAVFAGDAAAEIISCGYLYLRYRSDIKRQKDAAGAHIAHPVRRIISISLPLTAGRYLNSLLRTAENLLVPRALYKYSKKGALSLFGMIKGMALPILFFPSVILNAVSTLLIPEMSEAAGKHKGAIVRVAVEEILSVSAIIGFIFSAIFAAGGYEIGFLLYKSADVGFLLTALSPIVPLMYVDSLCDGLLKGLDQQKFTFFVSVFDSAARLLLIFPVLERFGIKGFIAIMYFSNLLTALLNVGRLIKISGAGLNAQKAVVVPILSAFSSTLIVKVLLGLFELPSLVYIILLSSISICAYLIIISYFNCINLSMTGRIRTHRKYAAPTDKISLAK